MSIFNPPNPLHSGRRGTGILHITTAPTTYTTATEGVSPSYRIALSTVTSQSKVDVVLAGDTLEYSYYHYPVILVDSSYVYAGPSVSIRGAIGPEGPEGAAGTTADIYSTTSTKIGTWINGKPLYRVASKGTTASNENWANIVGLGSVVDTVVTMRGCYKGSSGYWYPIPRTAPNSSGSDTYYVVLGFNTSTGYFQIKSSSGEKSLPYIAIIEYTKTSDAATINASQSQSDTMENTLQPPRVNAAPASASSATFDISIND